MRNSPTKWFACCLIAGALNVGVAAPVELMPGVSEVEWGQATAVEGGGVVVVSDQATPPEREAARLLCRYVERRFGQKWPTHTAGDVPAGARLRVYPGQAKTFPALDRLCDGQKLAVPEQQDGYALKVWTEGGKTHRGGRRGRTAAA